jgi:predicted nucleic acid-binding protein
LPDYVLDSYAVLVWILDQPGADKVDELLNQAASGSISIVMSMINAGEVRYMLAKKKGEAAAEQFEQRMMSLPIRYVMPDAREIIAAARLKSKYSISYADCFAVGLAVNLKAPLVTGDPELLNLRDMLSLEWLER